jgi:glycosyltransferase involved in cell wall biosynthesis
MTIFELCDFGSPYGGSFVPMVAALAREAALRGHTTTALFPPRAAGRPWLEQLELDVARIVIAPSRSRTDLRRLIAGLAADAASPVVFHTHFSHFDVPATLAAIGHDSRHVVWHEHGNITGNLSVKLRNAVRFGVLGRFTDTILCVGPSVESELLARFAPANRLVVFPNAIDLNHFKSPTTARRLNARQRFGFARDDFVVLHFGWDWWRKGGDLLASAARQIQYESQAIAFASVRAPKDIAVAHGIRCLPAAADVVDLYAAADLFVSASRSEGMPFAVLEALASGLPVLATDISGHTGIGPCPNLQLVPQEDAEAIARGILDVAARPREVSERLRANARAWIDARFGLEPWASRLVDRCEQIVSA